MYESVVYGADDRAAHGVGKEAVHGNDKGVRHFLYCFWCFELEPTPDKNLYEHRIRLRKRPEAKGR